MLPRLRLPVCLTLALAGTLSGQSLVLKLSPGFDASDAPSAVTFPGLGTGFRQQILLGSQRLGGLPAGRQIRGIWIRRDLNAREAIPGGEVDMEIRIGASVAPNLAQRSFALNAPRTIAAFVGRVTIPTAPALGTTMDPWSSENAVLIRFQTPVVYGGGHVALDIRSRPVAGKEPGLWMLDAERGAYDGVTRRIGRSCSPAADRDGVTLVANEFTLQVGSTVRLTGYGRPGVFPMLILGASEIPGGADLTAMGAPGCRQFVDILTTARFSYLGPAAAAPSGTPAVFVFDAQIPADPRLLGLRLLSQVADNETALPRARWTNAAGLTTSNGLELRVSALGPDLGMAVVTSEAWSGGTAPSQGRVDVSVGPVLRILHD